MKIYRKIIKFYRKIWKNYKFIKKNMKKYLILSKNHEIVLKNYAKIPEARTRPKPSRPHDDHRDQLGRGPSTAAGHTLYPVHDWPLQVGGSSILIDSSRS